MQYHSLREKQARHLRLVRRIHHISAIYLFLAFILLSITGILLGIKKQSGGLIQAKNYNGVSADMKGWLPVDSLYRNACLYLKEQVPSLSSLELDRVDIRTEKGMAKFLFKEGYWGVQVDCTTGKLLHIEKRYSDLIEQIHDGSIMDYFLGTSNGEIKLLYSSLTGMALLLFSVTGFWLWYGPRKMRKRRGIKG